MISKESIFIIFSILAGITLLVLGIYTRSREKSTRANLFFLVLLFLSINVFSYFFELTVERIEIKETWNKVFYTSLVFYLSLWLLFSIEYKYENLVLSRHFRIYLILLCAVPGLTILFIWYDPNGLFLSLKGIKKVGSLSSTANSMGPLYWIHSAYSWILVISTIVLILFKISRLGKEYRLQAFAIGLGVLTPMLYNLTTHFLFFVLKIPAFQFKLTQLMYTVTAITFTWGIFSEKFLDIVPIARRIVFDNVDDLIFVFNRENRVIDANRSAKIFFHSGVFDYFLKDIEGRSVSEIFAQQHELLNLFSSHREGRNEIILQSESERMFFDVSLSRITDKKNILIGYVAILRDITDIRNTQQRLVMSEKMAALGGLVAGMAHEINTPIGISITAASALIEETNKIQGLYSQGSISRADFRNYMDVTNQSTKLILSNVERTASLVQSFKQVSVDQSTEQKRRFKLHAYFEDIIRSLNPTIKGKNIEIVLQCENDIELDSYPGTFSQIITNLTLNSIIHGFDEEYHGLIEIKANVDNNNLIIEFTDNGKGIQDVYKNKIFEPFFTTNKKKGTGLGLHIVYNLVTQKLNGTIECESELNRGTKFKISIPK